MNFWSLALVRIFSTLSTFAVLLFFALSSFAMADEVNYFYDDARRLVRAVNGTEGVVYEYDQVEKIRGETREIF